MTWAEKDEVPACNLMASCHDIFAHLNPMGSDFTLMIKEESEP